MRPRRALAVAAALLILVAISGVVYHEAVWRELTTKRILAADIDDTPFWFCGVNCPSLVTQSTSTRRSLCQGHPVRGWVRVKRWTEPSVEHGELIVYHEHTGFKAADAQYIDGQLAKSTSWYPNGTVSLQWDYFDESGRVTNVPVSRDEPPWWWGVTDQTEPTAPWWNSEGRSR